MSCVTYYNPVGSELCASNMTAGVTEDDEISGLNSSCTFLPTNEDAQKLFILLTSRDKSTRELALSSLIDQVLQLAEYTGNENGIKSDLSQCNQATNGQPSPCQNSETNSVVNKAREVDLSSFGKPNQVLNHILTSFLRLSMWCPFDDVRFGCNEALMSMKHQGISVPRVLIQEPSSFIPHKLIPPVDTDDEETYSLYVESYMQTCRLEHMVLVMGMHPQYLKDFLSVNMYLLKSDGALPYSFRSYIGILAAARHKCQYLVHLMETDFLMAGGDAEWLRGVEYACPKLQSLSTLNKLLAHRPWLVNSDHIKRLCTGGDGWQWSHSELVQAIVLLCHFHSLAVFCHGTGINLEIDHTEMSFASDSDYICPSVDDQLSGSHSPTVNFDENDIEALMRKMQELQDQNEEEVTREEMNRRFEKQKNEASKEIVPEGNFPETVSRDSVKYSYKYINDVDFNYQDFAKRSDNEIPTFRAMDFNWQDHAYSLINSYMSVGDMLDAKFNTAYHLTYNTLATKEHVDTSKLRRAIWMYLHCTCGIMFDDYNYGEVNQLLERSLKSFIKTASCFPELTTKSVYDAFWKQFRHSEKVHVNIVLLEGRFQVELLYALRAVTEYIK